MKIINPVLSSFQTILESDYFKSRIDYINNTYIPFMQKLSKYVPDHLTDLNEENIKQYKVPKRLGKGKYDILPRAKKILFELEEIFRINGVDCEKLKESEELLGQDRYQFGNQARQVLKIIENHNFEKYDLKTSLQELSHIGAARENVCKILRKILIK